MAGFSQNISLLILFGFFVLLGIFAYLLGGILLKFATNLGVRSHGDDAIRWTSATKPSLGGILFFFSFLLSTVFYLIILSKNSQFNNLEFMGMVVCCTLGFIMGLADDAYNTRPLLKLFVQILCGVVAILCGNQIHIFSNNIINYIVTIVWFVGIMNSLNMLDNMDAITSSVSIVACIFMLILSYHTNTLFSYDTIILYDSILLIGMAASIIAFLRYNWHPSKMFMGDSGSQFMGAFLAYAAIKILWNANTVGTGSTTSVLFFILLPVSFFIITISDTTAVFINRLLNRKSPFIGGKDHTTHHLVFAGLKQRTVAILYIVISSLSSLGGFLIYYYHLYNDLPIVILFGLALFTIFVSLFIVTRKYKNELEPGHSETTERKQE